MQGMGDLQREKSQGIATRIQMYIAIPKMRVAASITFQVGNFLGPFFKFSESLVGFWIQLVLAFFGCPTHFLLTIILNMTYLLLDSL